jgi:glucuronosyltransferase
MIIIPFTGQQFRNGLRAQKDKVGVMINFDDLDAVSFKKAIDDILNDESYFQSLKVMSEAFRANPVEPIEEALFWIENVAKKQGAAKLDASHLSWVQKCGYDVIAFYFGLIFIFIIFWAFTIRLIVGRYRKKQERGKFKYY